MDDNKIAPNQAEPRLLVFPESIKTLDKNEHFTGGNHVLICHKLESSERNGTQFRNHLHGPSLLGIFSISNQWWRDMLKMTKSLRLVVLASIMKQTNEANKEHPFMDSASDPASSNLLF